MESKSEGNVDDFNAFHVGRTRSCQIAPLWIRSAFEIRAHESLATGRRGKSSKYISLRQVVHVHRIAVGKAYIVCGTLLGHYRHDPSPSA